MSLAEIAKVREKAASGELNPMDAKMELARRIISDFHSTQQAREAEEGFRRVFQEREQPNLVSVLTIRADPSWVKGRNLIKLDRLLFEVGLASSVSEAGRKLKEGAVYVNGSRYRELLMPLDTSQPNELLLKLGRQYRKALVNVL